VTPEAKGQALAPGLQPIRLSHAAVPRSLAAEVNPAKLGRSVQLPEEVAAEHAETAPSLQAVTARTRYA
jgi:hypothetical protein